MFLQISKSPEEEFHRVISEENPAENENEGRYSKPQRLVCDIDPCVILPLVTQSLVQAVQKKISRIDF